ncbi:chemotaxis protein CheC [Fulvivirga ligni]|uniref:chemotaxis protein CheC n=1 Tax=Fulvivirga ligni TaxID=2904246 RepID=UPI001F345E6B|nr:chemotaxis protein CheC [Fulvivirga ligni]UII21785.1 chemotaxis protein CheC [Fulvivirga ligni]
MMLLHNMTSLEKDILKELMNIILAKAADSFAKISKEEVLINVPELKEAESKTALEELLIQNNVEVIIQSEVKGDIYAHTLLLFSDEHMSKVESIFFKRIQPSKKMRESLLLEWSNILTGTMVTHLANFLKVNIYGSVPMQPIYRDSLKGNELLLDLDVTRPVLFTVNALFMPSESQISLPMILIFDIPNMEKILHLIREINKDDFRLLKL